MKKNKIWFFRKTYGYGWTPSTWEGWLVILVWLIIFISLTIRIEDNLISNLGGVLGMTGLLIYIYYKKGEKPRWQ